MYAHQPVAAAAAAAATLEGGRQVKNRIRVHVNVQLAMRRA